MKSPLEVACRKLGRPRRDHIDGLAPPGEVRGIFDDLDHLPVEIENRIVGSLDPDISAAFADALILSGVDFTSAKSSLEFAVLAAFGVERIDEQAVVLTTDSLSS